MEIRRIYNMLEEYGLSDKESKVYIATLMLGTAKVNEIAEKAKLLRETTYAVLKSLKEKGIVSYVIKSGIRYFSASDPERLIGLLDEKKKRIESVMKELKELKQTAIKKPVVEFYEGSEGMLTASDDIVRKGNKTVLAYVNTNILKVMPFYHPGFRLRRRERKVFLKAITEKSSESEKLKELDKKELRETRFFDKIMKGLKSSFFVYEDKVLFLKASEKEQFGVIIQDKELAELQRKIFENIWSKADRD